MAPTPTPTQTQPTDNELDDVLDAARYGELADIQAFVAAHGPAPLSTARDPRGNTVLHMASANGHADVLAYVLPLVDDALLAVQNDGARSTALHWAVLNTHLAVAKALVARGGPSLIDVKNAAGRTPLGEAELADWREGVNYLIGEMRLDSAGGAAKEEEGAEVVDAEDADGPGAQDVEVEIEDADGRVARMTLGTDEKRAQRDEPPPPPDSKPGS